jgi:hypothetical protein
MEFITSVGWIASNKAYWFLLMHTSPSLHIGMCFIESMGQQEWVMSVIPARHLQENVSLRGLGKLILNNMN